MNISQSVHDDIVVFSLQGSLLGEPEDTELREKIREEIDAGRRKFILNCTDLSIMNSTGLGVIIATVTTLRRVGGELHLANVNSKVEGVLILTQINRIVRIYDTIEKAIRDF